jgi:hypothetical protein
MSYNLSQYNLSAADSRLRFSRREHLQIERPHAETSFMNSYPTTSTVQQRAMMRMLPAVVMMCSSGSTIATHSPSACEQALTLKVGSLALMDKTNDSSPVHYADIDDLLQRIEKARDLARGRSRNEISLKQWEILMDPKEGLLGEFLKRWFCGPIRSQAYLSAKKNQIAKAFDTIIGLESCKIRHVDIERRQS